MEGLEVLSTTDSNNTAGSLGSLEGATIMDELPAVYWPVRTRTTYMRLSPCASGDE